MKKLLFLLLLLPVMVTSQQLKKSKVNKDSSGNRIQVSQGTWNGAINNSPYYEQTLKLDSTLQQLLLKKLSEEKENKWWEWLVPLIASIIFSAAAVWFSWVNYRRDKKYKDLAFISEIDKLLLEHPELWAYEDDKRRKYLSEIKMSTPAKIGISGTEKILIKAPYKFIAIALREDVQVTINWVQQANIPANTSQKFKNTVDAEVTIVGNATLKIKTRNGAILQSLEDKLLDDKLDAFCYYKLNNFELALKGHKANSSNKAAAAWIQYLRFIHAKSERFRNIIAEVRGPNRQIYNADFVKKIEEILR
jgi:hypothetical protein